MKRFILPLMMILFCSLLFAQTEAKAVIYEEGFEGSVTASGEVFSQNEFTAAHGFLALGTQVEIMNIYTGKKVIVIINDRLKNVDDLFWLTSAAAKEIDLVTVMPMEILYSVVGEPAEAGPSEIYQSLFESLSENLEIPQVDPTIPLAREDQDVIAFGVQVYATLKRMDAVTLSRRIQQELEYISYFEKFKTDEGQIFRVVIGDFDTKDEALDCYRKLRYDIPHIFLVEIY